ncbi:putative nucleotidyltransferase, ribonuclease H [Tanacetum coccineum]
MKSACGRVFEMGANKVRQDPNVITGTFFIKNHHASILFDTGADNSFVSIKFKPLLGLEPSELIDAYTIKLANGKMVEANKLVQGCTLHLSNHTFNLDLILMELGSFDIVIAMDCLSKNRYEIVCHEKIIQIPFLNAKTLEVKGARPNKGVKKFSCMQPKEKQLQDIPITREHPEVFPNG